METDTAMALWNWPDPPLVKTITGGKLHPIWHRVADIVTDGMTYLRRNDGIITDIESVLTRALVPVLRSNEEISFRRRMGRDTNTAGGYQQWAVSLHHIDHLLGKGDLDHYLGGIFGLVGGLIVVGPLIKLGAACEEEEREQ